jgi:hypothetical protein
MSTVLSAIGLPELARQRDLKLGPSHFGWLANRDSNRRTESFDRCAWRPCAREVSLDE